MRRASVLGLGVIVLAASPAAAQVTPEKVNEHANQVDAEIAGMRTDLAAVENGYAFTLQPEVGKVERRLREGEIHFLLKDYLRAAIVLLDVVEDPELRGHPQHRDCVFLLAESLRMSRNFSGAQAYYEGLLPDASGERLKDIVLGLLQIAGATNQYDDVDRHVARLRQAGAMSRPDVDYIYGKMLFKGGMQDPQKLTKALEVFAKIPEGTSVSARGAYYAGVTLVQLGQYEQALRQFELTLTRIGTRPDDQPLRELTYLSMGRLYQELGDVTRAADAYQEIDQGSPYFSDMLFEVAWAHVRDAGLTEDVEEQKGAFTRALRALELLMATAPTSRLYPQARILQGNLQIRLGASETAYDTFETIVDEYGGARDKIEKMVREKADTKQFFRDLLAADVDELQAQTVLPPLAVTWALEEKDMERAVAMERDLQDSESFMQESRDLVDQLQAALLGEQRFNMFPGLREARSKAISVENRSLNARRRLLDLERRMVEPSLAEAQRAQLTAVHARAVEVEQEIATLPQSDEQVDAGRVEIRQEYLAASRRAHQLRPRLVGMQAQLVAVELWLRDNRGKLDAEEQALMDTRIVEARGEIRALEEALGKLESEIRQAADLVEGDAGRGRARRLAEEYKGLMTEELAILRAARGSVAGDLQGGLQRIDQQRLALDAIDQRLADMQQALDGKVRDKVDEVRLAIAQEAARLDGLEQEHAGLTNETQALLGPVADRTLAAVGKQFRDLVLKADVGIIDVAWARKQTETDKVNDLIREQQRRSSELELEFAEFLRE
jgi:tetratricopeptide (TPR) repeat protein